MSKKNKHIHFIGIGGIGMSGIASLCLKQGHKVTGSDVKPSRITEKLKEEGADICIGHKKENLAKPSLVVYSSAVTFQNPELRAAVNSNIPTWQRGVFLGQLMKDKIGIAVSGSHGKTTTSSLITTMLNELGHKPTAMIGAIVERFNGNVLLGDGKYFVTEADESDGSFLSLAPTYAIITNIDQEHLDYYSDMEHILQAYLEFVSKMPAKGTLVCCGDDENIKTITPKIKKRILRYGFRTTNTLYAEEGKFHKSQSEFNCIYKKRKLGKIKLNIPGEHNILNAMAAVLLGLDMGIKFNDIKRAIEKYHGAERRLQVKAEVKDILVIDDYAHHPSEIQATLKACKNFGKKRIIAVFQPHRYTRTRFLYKEFARSFADIDLLILTDIYPASEQPIYGVTSKCIYDEVVKLRMRNLNVTYLTKEQICQHLLNITRKGDLVIIMGAGDIYRVGDEFVEKLRERAGGMFARKM